VQRKVLLQQGKIKPKPDPRRRVEGSPDLSPESNLGEGNVCRTDLAANLPNQMGLRGTTTSNTPERTTRRNTTCTQPQGAGEQGKGWVGLYQQGQYQQGRNGQSRGTQQQWTNQCDARHPKIKALIDPLLAKDNRIPVKAICQASRVQLYDMPGLQKYRDSTGRSTICWNSVLKGCGWTKCPLRKVGGHVPREEITDGFANAICNKLGKGVLYLMTTH
jgi:hypothetical protein